MQQTFRVFISATSGDLASYRQVVKEALLTNSILPVEQTNFPPDFRSVEQMLEAKIRDCYAVICLVGFVYGAEPADRPADRPRRSYTQMESDIAHRLGKPVYQFLANEDCAFDAHAGESPELQALQLAHRQAIEAGVQIFERFSNQTQLRERIGHIQFTGRSLHLQNLPYPSLGSLFKGREPFLHAIREHLLAHSRENNAAYATAITQRQALCGLGGVGKTRLAVEYGWRYEDEYSATLFVVADSPESLRRNLAQLTGPMVLNLPEQDRQEEEVKMAAAIRWLLEHPGWFLILDNVDNRPSAQAVEDLLARIPGGHVLITSRLGDWSKDVEPLELDVLSAQDAKSFLLDRTKDRRRLAPEDDADAFVLCKELDGIALALEQAGAFIERQRCSLGDYLKRWRAGEARVRQWFDPRLMHYPKSVAIAYDTTMREVGAEAVALFHLLSWFAPDPLPQTVLEGENAANVLAELVQPAEGSALNPFPEEALAELAAFSMVRKLVVDGVPCVSQHRLVQELTQSQMPNAEQNGSLLGAVRLLGDFAPKDAYRPEVWKEWRLLIAHAEALWAKVQPLNEEQWNTALMDGLALYYLGQGRYQDAIPIQQLILKIKGERLGERAAQSLLAKNDLALLFNSVGRYEEAQTLYREALEGWASINATDYEFGYAETLHNLGFSLMCSGHLDEGETKLRGALKIFLEKSGEFHWRTLMTEYSLARTLLAKGETGNAVQLLRANIEKKAAHLPEKENHPDTLDSIMLLAKVQMENGELAEAESLARRAIAGRERALGKDDSDTLEAVALLTVIYLKQGRNVEAEALRARLIDANLRSGNPEALLSIRRAAYNFFVGGEYTQAEKLLRGLVEKGFETAGNRCHLARVLILTGRAEEAQEHVAYAWGNRAGAAAYVTPRILWFQIALLCCLHPERGIEPAHLKLLGKMKTAMQSADASSEWSMTPVLLHLESCIREADFKLLEALVSALNDRAHMQELDSFPAWRDQPAVELDAPLPGE